MLLLLQAQPCDTDEGGHGLSWEAGWNNLDGTAILKFKKLLSSPREGDWSQNKAGLLWCGGGQEEDKLH